MENIILTVGSGEATSGNIWGRPLAHLVYRMGGGGGEGPHLFRANAPVAPRGGTMVIEDIRFSGGGEAEPFCGEVLRECAARRFNGVACRFLGKPRPVLHQITARLGELCRGRGIALYVTEPYAGASGGKALVSTAVSGGSLRGLLTEMIETYGADRVALWVEPVAEDFLLPSPTGAGAPLTREELERRREEQGSGVFFSPELCAHYFTYMAGEKGHFVLFDDAVSIRKKLWLGRELELRTAFLPYREELTREVLREEER